MRRNLIIMALVAVMSAGGGYFVAMMLDRPTATPSQAVSIDGRQSGDLVGSRRPDFSLTDLDGAPVAASDFDGSVWLLNFWASWCAPCVEEMPMLSDLHRHRKAGGLAVVGIALDDPQRAREFATELNLTYPILVGQTETLLVGRQFGNRGGMLPYSVLIDGRGTIRWTRLGMLDRADLLRQVEKIR